MRYNAAVNCATQLQGVDDATVASFKGPGEAAVIPAVGGERQQERHTNRQTDRHSESV